MLNTRSFAQQEVDRAPYRYSSPTRDRSHKPPATSPPLPEPKHTGAKHPSRPASSTRLSASLSLSENDSESDSACVMSSRAPSTCRGRSRTPRARAAPNHSVHDDGVREQSHKREQAQTAPQDESGAADKRRRESLRGPFAAAGINSKGPPNVAYPDQAGLTTGDDRAPQHSTNSIPHQDPGGHELIRKPAGQVAVAPKGGYLLIEELGWDVQEYRALQVGVNEIQMLAAEHLDITKTYSRQPRNKIQIICDMVSFRESGRDIEADDAIDV
ncbi:hypothetical protein AURDEDRAFT_131398 [Auricularia subglabra TFB-10046 SS5]|uniref:Uncharacterized protein n=1 Tax=Auricularia subglabra (strain TFB-10046 / SS5) TaxID=717982 RepID=J0LC06_AURST|nr:hypothetical protein AURDEDRAFT_131398 [Auricularia subglabra TFB-10046 SS5]